MFNYMTDKMLKKMIQKIVKAEDIKEEKVEKLPISKMMKNNKEKEVCEECWKKNCQCE